MSYASNRFLLHCRSFWQSVNISESIDGGDGGGFNVDDRRTMDEETSLILDIWSQSLPLERVSHNALLDLKKNLRIPNRIRTDTMVAFNICTLHGRDGLILPRFLPSQKPPSGMKIVRIIPGTAKYIEEVLPRTQFGGLFGFNIVLAAHKEVVLTVSEVDAMAVYQETRLPAFAVDEKKLSHEAITMLDDFDKIHIWFPASLFDRAKLYAHKLLWSRCHVVKPANNPGAPATVLQEGGQLVMETVRKSEPLMPTGLFTFHTLRAEVFHDMQYREQQTGVKWMRYKRITAILKGFRMGEVTILTGSTGSGKTTFLGEYAIDLCEQGIPTLWASFDVSSHRLARMMLKQFSRMDLENHIEKFDYWADKFSQLPLLFMNFHGTTDVRKVADAIERTMNTHDIQHIILDNLQFMIGAQNDSADKFRAQNEIVTRFRRLATEKNAHVTLVVAPRKESAAEELTTESLHGGEKAAQAADNLLVIQQVFMKEHPYLKKYLQVVKNRYDGELELSDRCSMVFDRRTNCYSLGKPVGKNNKYSGD